MKRTLTPLMEAWPVTHVCRTLVFLVVSELSRSVEPVVRATAALVQLWTIRLTWGASGTNSQLNDSIHYSVSTGNVNLLANAIMDRSTKKSMDAFQFGASLGGLMETGKIAMAYISKPDKMITYDPTPANPTRAADADNMTASGTEKSSSTFFAGEYGIGSMTMYLGVATHSAKNSMCAETADGGAVGNHDCLIKSKGRTTFAGVRGSVGDTGVGYLFQVRKNKTTNTLNDVVGGAADTNESSATDDVNDNTQTISNTPWMMGVYRSLGGGASVNFEYGDPDGEGGLQKGSSILWVQVNF